VRLEGLGQLKKSTSSGLEPATFRLVVGTKTIRKNYKENLDVDGRII
jgi:hypothetical protein